MARAKEQKQEVEAGWEVEAWGQAVSACVLSAALEHHMNVGCPVSSKSVLNVVAPWRGGSQ